MTVLAVTAARAAGGAAGPFARCDSVREECPYAKCIADVALEKNLREEAVQRLSARVGGGSRAPCLLLELGIFEFELSMDSAQDHLHGAIEGYMQMGDPAGEFWARINLVAFLRGRKRFAEAEEEVEKASNLAARSGDIQQESLARIEHAQLLQVQGKDHFKALKILDDVESRVFEEGSHSTRTSWLVAHGTIHYELGLYPEALRSYRRLLEIVLDEGDRYREAQARYNVLLVETEMRTQIRRHEIVGELRRILRIATESKKWTTVTRTHSMLALFLAGRERREHLERCVELAREIDMPDEQSQCRQTLAADVAHVDPARARQLLNESLRLSLETRDPWPLVYGAQDRMRVSWATLPAREAFEESVEIFDDIEKLRELQTDRTGRARLFAIWAHVYYWLSGTVLQQSDDPTSEELERAFAVIERLRSRVLLDALESAEAVPELSPNDPLARQREDSLHRIVQIQRRLLDPELTPDARAEALGQLEDAEIDEAQLRRRIAETHPGYATLRETRFATLAQIRRRLGPNEALLSFQVAPSTDIYGDFAGGSWLLVVTREGTRAYRLPDRDTLESKVRILVGLERREKRLRRKAVQLYDVLLRKALDELPPGVEHLVILPDGPLHLLPFGALRATREAPPLAARFRLSAAPSATLWQRLRQNPPELAAVPVLALAAPELPDASELPPDVVERNWLLESGLRLPPLANALWEGKAVIRHLGGRSRLLEEEDATERSFKEEAEKRGYRIFHFATHTLIDPRRPERSAVVLAPGSDDEDGLLQFREIVDLDLQGRVVVLSACQSASGEVLQGEGVMSLARAFFQAGAHAVVGSFWRLRDDEAAILFNEVYQHLGRGMSFNEALWEAQKARIDAGDPTAAWAGLVVLGDGELVPLPGGRTDGPRWLIVALALGLLALSLTGLITERRSWPTRVRRHNERRAE